MASLSGLVLIMFGPPATGTVPGTTGSFAPRPVRGAPALCWAAMATPANMEKGRLKDLELRTFEAQDLLPVDETGGGGPTL